MLSELLVDPLGLVEVAQPKSELSIAYEQLYGDLRLSLIKNSRPASNRKGLPTLLTLVFAIEDDGLL
jgi:hypothetical protein